YYSLGDDGNYLDQTSIESEHFNRTCAQEIIGTKAMIEAIKECVFMEKGAYGLHLEPELQDRIAHKFLNNISKNMSIYKLRIPQIEMGSGIFNAPCTLAIED